MNIWLTIFLGGALTFGMRFSFVYLLGRFEVPEMLRRGLRFVPPAVLSAILIPELFIHDNHFDLSLDNTRLLAGLAAIVVAAWTKNSLLTILAGLAALLVLQLLGVR